MPFPRPRAQRPDTDRPDTDRPGIRRAGIRRPGIRRALLACTTAAVLLGSVGLATARTDQDGDPLQRFTHQTLDWGPCQDPALDQAGARCADVTAPLDYRDPDGRTLTVAISRIAATDTDRRIGTLLHGMGGGPGGPGLTGPLLTAEAMGRELAARYDLVGMDPRGVGESSAVHCQLPGEWIRSPGLDRAAFQETVRHQRDLVRRCQQREGDVLPHITTRNTARDMDLVRTLLGERRVSYLGTSYGTYLGAVYAQMFPRRVDRLVLDSAIDPARYPVHLLPDTAQANEEYLDAWADWTAQRHATYGLGESGQQVRAVVEGLVEQAAREPLRFGEYRVDEHVLPSILVGLLTDDEQYAQQAALVVELYRAARGEEVTPSEGLLEYLVPPDPALDNALSMNLAIFCGDAEVPRDTEWYWRNIERSRATAPVYGPLTNTVHPCAFWPTRPVEPPTPIGDDLSALIVQATGDMRTPYPGALRLRAGQPESRLVTLEGVRRHGVYGYSRQGCVERAVNAYLASGALPDADLTCRRG